MVERQWSRFSTRLESDGVCVRLLASVPIVVTSYRFVKRDCIHRDLGYLIHSDKGYQFNSYV